MQWVTRGGQTAAVFTAPPLLGDGERCFEVGGDWGRGAGALRGYVGNQNLFFLPPFSQFP